MPSLPRERIDARLSSVWQARFGVVIAPAGSGKTTLLANFATSAGVPVAWYRAESRDADEVDLLRYLEAAFARCVPGIARGWTSVEDAVDALEAVADAAMNPRLLLVVDDLHTLEATPAESALERLVEYAPPNLAILAGARVPPRFNLSRLRVSAGLVELHADDVRFRSWEVERLFRDFYGEMLGPEELATVARRTGGWAAGLQLFHLATSGTSPDERRRVLAGMTTSARLLGEYLTRNVLDQLPGELRRFLIETSVLPILTGPLCDAYLARTGSAALLRELERRQVFTATIDDEGTYRYHEVLRTTLVAMFADRHGEAALRDAHRRAGELLEAAGALSEALTAFGRAGSWEVAERLIREAGQHLADGTEQNWLDAIPATLLRHDPWLVLATARRHRAEGRWVAALEAYQRAEAGFGTSHAALECRRERLALSVWLDAQPTLSTDWSSRLRLAVSRDPQGAVRSDVARPPRDLHGQLVDGLGLLAAGRVREARVRLATLADDCESARDSGPTGTAPPLASMAPVAAAAWLGAGVAGLLGRDPRARGDIQAAIGGAERAGLGWLSRVGRAILALSDGHVTPAEAAAVRAGFDHDGDVWTSALLGLLSVWLTPDVAAETGLAAAVAESFRARGAGTLEAWARGVVVLGMAQAGMDGIAEAAREADAASRASGTPGVGLLVARALEIDGTDGSASHRLVADAMAADSGLAIADPANRDAAAVVSRPAAPDAGQGSAHRPTRNLGPAPAHDAARADRTAGTTGLRAAAADVAIRCFGTFEVRIHGDSVNLETVKPRARAVLRPLAAHAGVAVHRKVTQNASWPDTPGATAARLLQVAISSLRGALSPGVGRGESRLITRLGDAYRLSPPAASLVDLVEFESALAMGRQARVRGDIKVATEAFARALDWYTGDLLPEDGPADWVVELRERYRLAALEAAQQLAELRLAAGDAAGAVSACARGLGLDRFHDPLWRLLIDGHGAAGDHGAASQARQRYDRMLAELGVAVR